jgi:hypothetical protein
MSATARFGVATIKRLRVLSQAEVLQVSNVGGSDVTSLATTTTTTMTTTTTTAATTTSIVPSILPLTVQSSLSSSSPDSVDSLLSLADGVYMVRKSLLEGLKDDGSTSAVTTTSTASSIIPSIPTTSSFTLSSLKEPSKRINSLLTSAQKDLPVSDMSHKMSTTKTDYFTACTELDVDGLTKLLEADPETIQSTHSIHGGTGLHTLANALPYPTPDVQMECIKILLENGIDINAQSSNGATPLHWAAGNGNHAVVGLLLERGADPDIPTYTWARQVFGKSSGQLPIFWAAESGCLRCLDLLTNVNPLSMLHLDERDTTLYEVAEKNLQFDAMESIAEKFEEEYVYLECFEEGRGHKML